METDAPHPTPHPSRSVPPFSLRLGHARALTTVQVVIHSPRAASLPTWRRHRSAILSGIAITPLYVFTAGRPGGRPLQNWLGITGKSLHLRAFFLVGIITSIPSNALVGGGLLCTTQLTKNLPYRSILGVSYARRPACNKPRRCFVLSRKEGITWPSPSRRRCLACKTDEDAL